MNLTIILSLTILLPTSPVPQLSKQVSLADAIRIAKQNNPALRAARMDAEGAKAGARAAHAMQGVPAAPHAIAIPRSHGFLQRRDHQGKLLNKKRQKLRIDFGSVYAIGIGRKLQIGYQRRKKRLRRGECHWRRPSAFA